MSTPAPFLQLPFQTNVDIMLAEIRELSEDKWLEHVNKACYSGDWTVVPLYCKAENTDAHPILQAFSIETDSEGARAPIMQQLPNVDKALQWLECPIISARLMALKPNSHIKPHRDHDVCLAHGQARLHLPLTTSDDVVFTVADERLPAKAGEMWYVDIDQVHSVDNHSDQERLHLVIDVKVNDWLLTQLAA